MPTVIDPKYKENGQIACFVSKTGPGCFFLFSTSAKELSYLLVGQISQGRGSNEQGEALIHVIAIGKYC